jgi:hypothetical protein
MPDFGCLIWSKREWGEEHLTSFHSKSEAGEKEPSSEAKISPSLTVPKKEVRAAAQTTCLSKLGQSVAAMRCPSNVSKGNVITLLVLGFVINFVLICSTPFSRSLDSLSSFKWPVGMPRMVWMNFKADK